MCQAQAGWLMAGLAPCCTLAVPVSAQLPAEIRLHVRLLSL